MRRGYTQQWHVSSGTLSLSRQRCVGSSLNLEKLPMTPEGPVSSIKVLFPILDTP